MFKRRRERVFIEKIKHFFYPDGGYKRAGIYWFHRLCRLDVDPSSISAGVSCGVSISFTPFLGFHIIGGYIMCLITRGNPLAMFIGQMFGNPWTLPIIWVSSYKLGVFLLGMKDTHGHTSKLTFELLKSSPYEVFLPMSVGGVLMAVAAWPMTFYIVRPFVARYQEKRKARINAGKGMRFKIIDKIIHPLHKENE